MRANAGRSIVEDEIAVVVKTRADGVRRSAERVQVERDQKVPDDLVVELDIEPVADITGAGSPFRGEVARGRG